MSAENLIAQHRYAEALDLLEAMAPPDRDCDVEYHRGVCLAGLARYEEALRAFDVAEDMGAEPYWLKWNRGAALHQIGRTEEAVQELVSAAFDHPLTEGARLYAAQVIAGVETKPKWIAPAMAALLRRVTARETPASAQRAELMAGGWQENRAYEASVQDALRDVIRPGDIVFDVGANIGGLAVPAARAVGPTGLVVAFEASPRNLPVLNGAIISSGLRNLWVVDRAVYARSGEMVPIFFNQVGYSDSLVVGAKSADHPSAEVETVTLDDWSVRHGLTPRVLKIDVEFAELDVLRGAERLLEGADLLVIMEVWHSFPDPVRHLLERGYVGCSLETFTLFTSEAEFMQTAVGNALFYRPGAHVLPLYQGAARWTPAATVEAESGEAARLELEAGVYAFWLLADPAAGEAGLTFKVRGRSGLLVDCYWPAGKYATVPLVARIERAGPVTWSAELHGRSGRLSLRVERLQSP